MADMRTRPLPGPVRLAIPEGTLKNPLGTDGATALGNNGMATAQMHGFGTQANTTPRLGAQPSFADLLQRNTTSAEPDRPAPAGSHRSAEAEPKPRPSKSALDAPRESARTARNAMENNNRADSPQRSRVQGRKIDETNEAEERRQKERGSETRTADALASGAQAAMPFLPLASTPDRNAEPQPTGSPIGNSLGSASQMTSSPEGDLSASHAALSPAPAALLKQQGPASSPKGQLAPRPGEQELANEPGEASSTNSLADASQRAAAHSAGGQPYVLSPHLQAALGLSATKASAGSQITTAKMLEEGVFEPSASFPRPPHDPLLFSATASALPNSGDPSQVLNTPSSGLDRTWLNDRRTWSDLVTVQPRPGANDIIDQMNQVQTPSPGAAQRFEELARGFDRVDFELLSAVPETFSGAPDEPGAEATAWDAFDGASAGARSPKIAGATSIAAAWDSRADLETRMQAVFSRLPDAPREADSAEGRGELQAPAASVAPWERARLESPLSAKFPSGQTSSAATSLGTTLPDTPAASLSAGQEAASPGRAVDLSTARQADLTSFNLAPSASAPTASANPSAPTHSAAWSSPAAAATDVRQVLPQNTGLSPGQVVPSSAGLAAGLRGGTATGRLDTPPDALLAASSAGQGTVKGRRLPHENQTEVFADQSRAAAPSPLEGTFGTDMGRTAGLPGSSPQARASSESSAVHQQVGQSALKLADQLAAQGTGTARLSIQDAATGPVDIVVNLDRKSGLTIEIQAESDETRKRIENQIDSIRENLESQNFRTVEVRLNGEGTSEKHNSNQSQQQNSQQSASSQQQQNQNGSFSGDGRGNNRERADGDRLLSQNGNSTAASDANPRSSGLRTQYASQSINEKGRINVRA